MAFAQVPTDTQKLASLAKVWGFLKYYHPSVATGRPDWDGQLIKLMSAVQQAQDRNQLSTVYMTLLDQLGPIKLCRKCQSVSDMPLHSLRNFDLSFLNDSTLLTNALRERLTYLGKNRNQGTNFYVQRNERIGNTSFEKEDLYNDMKLPDENYRLLALFRYWNIIHYFFPYKYAINENWNDVLTDLIPVFRRATTTQLYQKALYQVVARIKDSHGFMVTVDKSRCMRCERGTLWMPFELKLIGTKAIITRFYNDSIPVTPSLTIGTVISHIDGKPIQEHIDQVRPYVSASNDKALLRDVNGLIGVGFDKQAKLTVQKQGQDTSLTVNRYPFQKLGKAVYTSMNAHHPVSTWLKDSVGYINMGKLTTRQVDSVLKPLLTARAIIFDLRNYPQGTYWLIGRYLVDKPVTFARFTGPDMRFPGVFQPVGTARLPQVNRRRLYAGKVIVLINEDTQSHAEFTAMAFRTVPNVTLVGSPTAGADGNISWVPLPGGYRTAFSGIGVYYPDGRETQRVGIVPDVAVQPTVEGVCAGRDEVLEKATQLLLN